MEEELFLRIMQLSKKDKVKLLQALEEDLMEMGEGYLITVAKISDENEAEIKQRNEAISQQQLCVIEFEDHFIHLQKVCDVK
jgi:hypothetical protein